MLGSCPISSHFPNFPYTTSIFLAAVLVLNPRVGGFAYILGWYGPFKWTLLRDWQFLLLPQPPLVCKPEVMMLYFPGTGTLGYTVWPRAGMACSPGVPPGFYPPQVNMGPPILPATATAALPLLPYYILSAPVPISAPPTHRMNISSLNPWFSNFHTV